MPLTLGTLILAAAQLASSPSQEAVGRLEAHLPVQLVKASAPVELAGHYTGQTKELEKRVGPFLAGEDLYLFSDRSYVYCQWADILPVTIYDRGTWSAADGVLQLTSDPTIRWDPEFERKHVVVRRKAWPNEIMLLSLRRDVEYFEQNAGDDPELMLLIVGMSRVESFTEKAATAVKARLIKEAWNPEFFRK